MKIKCMFLLPVVYLFCSNAFGGDFNCATTKYINKKLEDLGAAKKLSKLEETEAAITLAYDSGPKSGNFGNEVDMNEMGRHHGLVFLSKENSVGNKSILDLYPALNEDIFKSDKSTAHLDRNYANNYNGIFQITYDQTRECRRQILITGFENDIKAKRSHFTGWINVEICDPKIAQLFAAGAQIFESQGKKMETIQLFFGALDKLVALGKVPKEAAQEIKDRLDTEGFPGVYYAKMENGHIAPRFSVRIKSLVFEKYKDECNMTMIPSSPYSGILFQEDHVFSEALQDLAYQDFTTNQKTPADVESTQFMHFWLSYWNEKGESVRRAGVLNPLLNKPAK